MCEDAVAVTGLCSEDLEVQQESLQLLRHGRGHGISRLFGVGITEILQAAGGKQVLVDQAAA